MWGAYEYNYKTLKFKPNLFERHLSTIYSPLPIIYVYFSYNSN